MKLFAAVLLVCGVACAPSPAPAVLDARSLTLQEAFEANYKEWSLRDPAGSYEGVKTILGEKIDARVTIVDETTMNFTISGVISIDCANEAYLYSDGKITLPGAATSGDCVHDALAANSVTLEGIAYDTSADHITVTVKYSFLSISLELDHTTEDIHIVQAVQPISELYRKYFHVFSLQAPEGAYSGSKTLLGQTIKAEVTFGGDSLDFKVTGALTVSCSGEAYSYASGVVTVPGASSKGDCVYDALESSNTKLEKIVYDTSSNHITVEVQYQGLIPVSIELDPESQE